MDAWLTVAKFVVALLAAAIVGAEVLERRRLRLAGLGLALAAVLATALYFAPAAARGTLVHRWEMFHYYLGAKYQPALGYEHLYACVTEADVLDHVRGASERPVRDLHTDRLTTGARAMALAGSCEARLGTARFAEFRSDVRAFRRLVGSRRSWEPMLEDHGYNPPPLWTMVGRAIASLHAPTRAFLTLVATLDVALMAGAVAFLAWGFGARVALLAVIFWGTQAPADFSWVGGGFLRQDWLFCAVAALALLRRRRPAWAGALLVTAGLLRLFPAVLLVGPGVLVLAALLRKRRLPLEHRQLVLGGVAAVVLLGGASALVLGVGSYARFWEHIQLRTGAISNHMGLRTLFSFVPWASIERLSDRSLFDPSLPWAAARTARLASLAVPYRLTAALFVLLVLFAAWRTRAPWLAVALSLPLIPALTEPSCYYYSVWVLALPLARARPAVGVTLLGLGAAGQLVALRLVAYDERYFALALLYVGSALVLLVSFVESPLERLRAWRNRTSQQRPDLGAPAARESSLDLGRTA